MHRPLRGVATKGTIPKYSNRQPARNQLIQITKLIRRNQETYTWFSAVVGRATYSKIDDLYICPLPPQRFISLGKKYIVVTAERLAQVDPTPKI